MTAAAVDDEQTTTGERARGRRRCCDFLNSKYGSLLGLCDSTLRHQNSIVSSRKHPPPICVPPRLCVRMGTSSERRGGPWLLLVGKQRDNNTGSGGARRVSDPSGSLAGVRTGHLRASSGGMRVYPDVLRSSRARGGVNIGRFDLQRNATWTDVICNNKKQYRQDQGVCNRHIQ